MAEPLVLPGFVNAHSHTFQRALRGRPTGGDFWAWREQMIAEATRQTPETVRRDYADTYREIRAAGYTGVGELHYRTLGDPPAREFPSPGLPEPRAAGEAAREAGVELTLLLTAYARGGSPRFRQDSVAEDPGQGGEPAASGVRVRRVAPHA